MQARSDVTMAKMLSPWESKNQQSSTAIEVSNQVTKKVQEIEKAVSGS